MSCPKNPKSWWIFKWEGPHDWFTYQIEDSDLWWEKHIVCRKCRCTKEVWPLEDVDLIRQGYDKLHKREYKWHFPYYKPYELGKGTKEEFNKEYRKIFG